MSRKLFVTTALPYANAPFHIGHIMEYIQADIWVRYQRMQKDDGKQREVYFVGADDVHGAPIMIAAEKAGKSPAEFVADIAAGRAAHLDGFLIKFDNWHSTDGPENHELSKSIYKRLRERGLIYTKTIEQFFDPCFYLVSPINTPDRFLEKEYFLNNQQTSIRKSIMEADPERHLFGIRGSAGTGKTLLLYDIAFAYGETRPTCIVHSGMLSEGHQYLKEHADRVDLLPAKMVDRQTLEKYEIICVDETQRLYASVLDDILGAAEQESKRCIFAYDFSQALSKSEIRRNNPERLNRIEGFEEFRLKDRVRTNNKINSFIRNMLRLYDRPKRKMTYEDVDVLCANDTHEADLILRLYMSRGYQLITLFPAPADGGDADVRAEGDPDALYYADAASSREVIGQEYDKVIVVMDSNFYYNEFGELAGRSQPDPDYLFTRLFYQNITRARSSLSFVVLNNPEVFETLIKIKNNRLNYTVKR